MGRVGRVGKTERSHPPYSPRSLYNALLTLLALPALPAPPAPPAPPALPALPALLVLLALLAPHSAAAQGKGQPKRPKAVASSSGGSGAPTLGGSQFGAWLDDASGGGAGSGQLGLGAGVWRAQGATLVDIPIIDVSYAVTDRVQLAASVPFYRATYEGLTSRGLDDVYLSTKIVAIDAASNSSGVGLSVTPLVEILSAGFADDRVHWALPVSVEFRASPVRVYASTGYFSRGSVFGAGALEVTTPPGTVVTGALTVARSTADETVAGAATASDRSDISISVAHPFTDRLAGYVSIGRSLSAPESSATTLGVSGGISIGFNARPVP